jgi:hypothetical protein
MNSFLDDNLAQLDFDSLAQQPGSLISGHCIAILVTQEMQKEKLTNTSWFVSFS